MNKSLLSITALSLLAVTTIYGGRKNKFKFKVIDCTPKHIETQWQQAYKIKFHNFVPDDVKAWQFKKTIKKKAVRKKKVMLAKQFTDKAFASLPYNIWFQASQPTNVVDNTNANANTEAFCFIPHEPEDALEACLFMDIPSALEYYNPLSEMSNLDYLDWV